MTSQGSADYRNGIGIMGASLGTGNRGVSALGASLVRLLDNVCPEGQPFMLIGSRESKPFELRVNGKRKSIPVVNYRQSPRARRQEQILWIIFAALLYRILPLRSVRRSLINSTPWIKAVVESKFVGEIRGGDSFSDIYGLKRFFQGSIPVLLVLLLGGRLVLFPQTYGPFRSPIAKRLARYILRRSYVVVSRDKDSLQVIKDLMGGPSNNVSFCPDVAFSLEVIPPAKVEIDPPLPSSRPEVLVGLNVNGLMYRGGYTQNNMFGLKLDYPQYLVRLVTELLAKPNLHVLLVPHTFAPPDRVESDPEGCRQVRRQLPPELQARVHIVTAEYDQNEIKSIIGGCDFFVGSRMHACIAALSQGIPTVGVAYSKKFVGVFETVGVGDAVVDGRTLDTEAALKATLNQFERRQELRPILKPRVAEAQAMHQSVFSRIVREAGK